MMPAAPLPPDEDERIAVLESYCVLDTPPEPEFDRVARLAAHLLDTPIALVSLVDRERQWFKACIGIDATETPREQAFCAYAIHTPEVLVVEDATADARFCDNPLVTDQPGIRFYAGAPLISPSGQALGTLCAIDTEPRKPSAQEIEALRDLARIAIDELELRRLNDTLLGTSQELSRSNEDLAQFAHAASHDLRSPLRHITSFAGLLKEEYGGKLGDEAIEWLDHIVNATRRLQSLTTDLIDYAKVARNDDEMVEIDLGDIVADCLSLLSSDIEQNEAEVEVGAMPRVTAIPAQMTQLLLNLLGNSLKYRSEAAPRIEINAREEDDEFVVEVRDNGIGIAPEYRERVFSAFNRLHTQDEYEGSGIGLAVCFRIVQRHGGRIWVDGAESGGSVFGFAIPKGS